MRVLSTYHGSDFWPVLYNEDIMARERPIPQPVQEDPILPRPAAPEMAAAAPIAPEAPVNREAKSVKEILLLQEVAFSARKDMMAFRHGKKVADLSPENQAAYKQLKVSSQAKRKEWLAELDKLPEDQQGNLKELTKLQEVRDRLASLPPEQIVTQALTHTEESYSAELRIVEAEITEMQRLLKYDRDTVRVVTALGSEEDLKELERRRKALIAKITAMSVEPVARPTEDLAGTARISPEPETPGAPAAETPTAPEPAPAVESVPATPEARNTSLENFTRSRAEQKAQRLELLRESMNALDKKILDKVNEHTNTASWSVFERMRINSEINALKKERRRLDQEMNERPGFGARFKESAKNAYKKARAKFKFEQSEPLTLSPNEYETPSVDDIERVEAEAAASHPEEIDETGSRWKWVKQRLVGLGTIGVSELMPAEKFRKGTKEVAKDLGSMSRTIEAERDLSSESAHEEANRIMAQLRAEGGDSSGDPRFLEISTEITADRIGRNNAKIDEIIVAEINRLEEKLKGYKGEKGQNVLTEENKNSIAKELRARLVEMRSGQAEFDIKEARGILRDGLDYKWKRRYLYAAIDAALWAIAIKFIAGKVLAGKAKETIATKGITGAHEATEVGLKDTIWAEAKRQWVSHGVANPSDSMIQQIATDFARESGVKVMKGGEIIWKATGGGSAVDTALAKGFIVKMGVGLKHIAAYKAATIAAM